jgi:hypothetical protein
MNNGPPLWNAILDQMPPGSIIAGGAVRDYFLGVVPKDIDVFVQPPPKIVPATMEGDPFASLELMISHDPRVGLHRIDDRYERKEEYEAMNNIALVSSGEMFGWKVDAVELIEPRTGWELIREFDFAVTRSWFGGGIVVHDTLFAGLDRRDKAVTLLLNDRPERSLKRFERFNARMGGTWSLR